MRGSKRARPTPAPPHLLPLPGAGATGGGGGRRRTGGDAADGRWPGAGGVAGRGRRARPWRGGSGGEWKRRQPVAASAVGARTGERGSGGVAVRLPRLRWQLRATERAGARPRCSRCPPFSDRRGRGSPGASSLLRREPRSGGRDRKSTRLNSSHGSISYAVFCLKKKKKTIYLVKFKKKKTKKI